MTREDVRDAAPGYEGLIYEASAGAGNWADGPWAATFDPVITDTAQHGYYPVYLFTRTFDAVYLSMNQGSRLSRTRSASQQRARR